MRLNPPANRRQTCDTSRRNGEALGDRCGIRNAHHLTLVRGLLPAIVVAVPTIMHIDTGTFTSGPQGSPHGRVPAVKGDESRSPKTACLRARLCRFGASSLLKSRDREGAVLASCRPPNWNESRSALLVGRAFLPAAGFQPAQLPTVRSQGI